MCRHVGHLLAVALASSLFAACASGASQSVAPTSAGPASALPVSTAAVVATATSAAPATRLLDGRPMTPCLVQGEVPVKAEVAGLCGILQVPEDRSKPDGRRIGLRVAVVPAIDASPQPDPLFVIAGGPGEASTAFFAWLPAHYSGVHETRDIVLVDQRGTGGSNPLVLPPLPATTGLTPADADAQLAAWMDEQLGALDADPRFYTSTVAAEDLEDVRAALGYERINLYGTSYGGTLAQYYLRQHGDRVRAAVLDGSTPLDVPVMERMAANSQHALDLLLSRCAENAACAATFPDLQREWSTLAAQLEDGITTSIVNPNTGEHAVADWLVVGPSLHNALLTEPGASDVPLAIHLAAQGQWERVGELVPPVASGSESLLMAHEILCAESWARFDPDRVAREGAGSFAGPMLAERATAQAALCRSLPRGVVPADDDKPLRTSTPILWITADGDPQDPPANLTAVASQQPNSLVVAVPAQEHVVGHLGCGPAVIAAFLNAGSATGLDTSCIERAAGPAPSFRLE